jgi:hypothetical protein
MELGEIVESGTHEDLLKQDGSYKKLMLRQLNNQRGLGDNLSPAKKQESQESLSKKL